MGKKLGRPAKKIREKPYFSILCTESERGRIYKKLNNARRGKPNTGLTISEYFLQAIGIRKGKQ